MILKANNVRTQTLLERHYKISANRRNKLHTNTQLHLCERKLIKQFKPLLNFIKNKLSE